MLKDLTYDAQDIHPSFIYGMIAEANEVDLNKPEKYFEHYATGIYRHDGYLFNSSGFIEEKCTERIIDDWVNYGVCDNYTQILEAYPELISDSSKNYVIILSTVERACQPSSGGWRWHKWGPYIGTQNPQHEYIYDDTHIDKVYCYHIFQVE